jgi:hypothetical protein
MVVISTTYGRKIFSDCESPMLKKAPIIIFVMDR